MDTHISWIVFINSNANNLERSIEGILSCVIDMLKTL